MRILYLSPDAMTTHSTDTREELKAREADVESLYYWESVTSGCGTHGMGGT